MNPTILLPELPDTTDPKAVKEYLAAHQKILADKQKDDYESTVEINNKIPNGGIASESEATENSPSPRRR